MASVLIDLRSLRMQLLLRSYGNTRRVVGWSIFTAKQRICGTVPVAGDVQRASGRGRSGIAFGVNGEDDDLDDERWVKLVIFGGRINSARRLISAHSALSPESLLYSQGLSAANCLEIVEVCIGVERL